MLLAVFLLSSSSAAPLDAGQRSEETQQGISGSYSAWWLLTLAVLPYLLHRLLPFPLLWLSSLTSCSTSSLDSIPTISCSVLHTSLYESSFFSIPFLRWVPSPSLPLSPVSHILLFSSDRGFHPMYLTTMDTSPSSHSSLLSAMQRSLLQLTSFHITHQKDFTFFSCSVHLTHNFKKESPVFP